MNHEEIFRKLVDKGKIIEAGFVGLRIAAIPTDASEQQISDMRIAFFAGAQHLFGSMIKMLEDGSDETEKDIGRMCKIQAELDEFIEEFKKRYNIKLPKVQ